MQGRTLSNKILTKSPEQAKIYGADEAWRWNDRVEAFSIVSYERPDSTMATVRESIEGAIMQFRMKGENIDHNRPIVGRWQDHIIVPNDNLLIDILEDLNYKFADDYLTNPIRQLELVYVDELTDAELNQVPKNWLESQQTIEKEQLVIEEEFIRNFKEIFGTEKVFDNPKVNLPVKNRFLIGFTQTYNKILNELDLKGKALYEFAYEQQRKLFLEKFDKKLENGQLDGEWHAYLVEIWESNFKAKVMDEDIGFYDSFENVMILSLQAAILDTLISIAKTEFSQDKGREIKSDEILFKLTELMYQDDTIKLLLENNIRESFIYESFIQYFPTQNLHKINDYITLKNVRNGAISEGVAMLNFMSKVLDDIYEKYRRSNDQIVDIPQPVFAYLYNDESEQIFNSPQLNFREQWRYLDNGLHSFIISEGEGLKRISVFGPVKHIKYSPTVLDIVKDAISGAYINARDNLAKGKLLDSELTIFLVSLRHNVKKTWEKAVYEVLRNWFETKYSGVISYSGDIKVSKEDLIIETIINTINNEIWDDPSLGISLNKRRFVEGIQTLINKDSFLNELIDKNTYIKESDKSKITKFLNNIIANINFFYTEIGILDNDGSLEIRNGILRNIQKSDYFITNKRISLEDLKNLGFTKIYSGKDVLYNLDTLSNINTQTELNKQYRILTHKTTLKRALIEVSGDWVQTPNEYVDGVIAGNRFIQNALLTHIDGNLLSSKFFDTESLRFRLKIDKNWFNNEYQNYFNNDEKSAIFFTVFSFSEGQSNLNLGTIIHLTDPAFRIDNLQYELNEVLYHFDDSQKDPSSKKEALIYQEFTKYCASPCYWFMDDKNLPLLKQDIEKNNEINVKIDMFSYFIFCIQQLYSHNNPDLNLPLVDSFFQIQGPSINREYSINYFKALLKTIGFNNIQDLSKISWFNINPDGSLRQVNALRQKEFCKTFLDHIQNSLLIEEFPILKNKNFLPDSNSITDQEFELIKTLDKTLCELFGYIGYTLLQLGILNFGIDTKGNLLADCAIYAPELLNRILRKFGIRTLHPIDPSLHNNEGEYIAALISSLLLSGQYKIINTVDENGRIVG